MVSDAEKYKKDDDLALERTRARNDLESYVYSLKNDEKLGDELKNVVKETIEWLDISQSASVEEYTSRKKSLEELVNDKMPKNADPIVEEVD
jgi:L1 cell adhesion molecule like protein